MDAKLQAYIDKLNALNFKEMYNGDFFLTWEKSDDELEAVFTVADALRYMRENNISTKVFESGLGISLFRDNSTRTRFSFASACNLLGLEVQDLDEGKSQVAHGETVRETANMISFMADVIGIRDDMYIGKGNKYMHEVVDAVTQGNKDGNLLWLTFSAISTILHRLWLICFTSSMNSAVLKTLKAKRSLCPGLTLHLMANLSPFLRVSSV